MGYTEQPGVVKLLFCSGSCREHFKVGAAADDGGELGIIMA